MEIHERNLFIAMCLGLQLDGNESNPRLESRLKQISAVADQQEINPLQADLADWLEVSLSHCGNRQDASSRLWKKIDASDLGLVDIPKKLRRQVFGGSLQIQKRFGRQPWHRRLGRKLLEVIRLIVNLAILGGVAWVVYELLMK